VLAGNALQQTYNAVDSLVVGNFLGKEALAAVGSTSILAFLIISLFSGLALGFTILVSQFLGAGNQARIKRAADTAYVVALVGAVPVTVLGLFAVDPLLSLLNTPAGPTREMASTYLSVIFLGTVGNFGYNLNAGILQGLGDAVSSLVFLAVATVMNIILDLAFVGLFGWGVAGVAWATVISQSVSFLLGTLFIVKKLKITTLVPRELRFDLPSWPRRCASGFRPGFRTCSFPWARWRSSVS
jgi:putative MATE family efflux protein